jgi:hypothetical protein
MKKYYVVEVDDEDWDLDSTPSYDSREEAEIRKAEHERNYDSKFTIWEVD